MTGKTELSGGPSLPQERRVVTAVPGPVSQELMARKQASVANGIGTVLPVFARAAPAVASWRTWTATPSSTSAPVSP